VDHVAGNHRVRAGFADLHRVVIDGVARRREQLHDIAELVVALHHLLASGGNDREDGSIQRALDNRSFSSRRGQLAAALFVGVKSKNNGSFASKYSLLGIEPLFHLLLIARWPRR
jgi:hypothetical protein